MAFAKKIRVVSGSRGSSQEWKESSTFCATATVQMVAIIRGGSVMRKPLDKAKIFGEKVPNRIRDEGKRKPRGIERKQVVSITTDAFPARTSIVLEDDNNITLWLFHS